MINVFPTFRSPAIISTLLVLPFIILELINRQDFRAQEGFPVMLFALLWLLPLAFILILRPTVRNVREGNRSRMYRLYLLLSVASLILIAWLWSGIMLDQMRCFLGVPHCD